MLDRWELEHAVIGEVTATGELRAFWERRGRRRDSGAPSHRRVPALRGRAASDPRRRCASARSSVRRPPPRRSSSCSARRRCAAASSCIAATTSSSGRAPCVGPGSTLRCCGLRPSMRGLALSLDGQGRIARLDPFTGGALAALEAARNVACVGGEPIGLTDCLNFGNPEKPEIGWELAVGDRRDRGRLRGARRFRSSRATSRSTTRRTDERSTRRRSSVRSGSSRT